MTNKNHNKVTEYGHANSVTGGFVTLMGETYYRIQDYDAIPPFFITVVSSGNHWLFVATSGGLAAGRISADHALFPYYTVDRITENADNTGNKSIVCVSSGGNHRVWEPFILRHYSPYTLERAVYKNIAGTSLVFEEVNTDLGLCFRYAWRTSVKFGIVKTSWIVNQTATPISLTITDGIQNILPAFVEAGTQNEFSVLLDAYKRSELDAKTGLGLFSLSSRLTDLAEPSEALRANTVWQTGLEASTHLLSSRQLGTVRYGRTPDTETDVRGQRGAYFVQSTLELAPKEEQTWHLVAEVDQDSAEIANLTRWLRKTPDLYNIVERDIAASSENLRNIVGGADGIQVSKDRLSTEHHFANVLFNVMRGGTFLDQYHIEKQDLKAFVATHSHDLLQNHPAFFDELPDQFTVQTLKELANAQGTTDLIRLCYMYLPLTFSRRHGDPSRPWNRFSIRLKNADGSPQLNYEGNWRDIFQNWEALSYSYPEFIEGMLSVFLNATTIDGYNPYRVMRDGIDWEEPEPGNPWANIGYWSDHQIIYLQKLMESCERFYPGSLQTMLTRPIFAFANVPYRIKPYADIVTDPYNTIDFDWDLSEVIEERVGKHGTDGKLVVDRNAQLIYVTLAEKLLNLLLAKIVNLVPGGGIWMNTQRPEWNDANNALVGKGISVVTTCYIRRFVAFFQQLLKDAPDELIISHELHMLYGAVHDALATHAKSLNAMTNAKRRTILDALGNAGSDYRHVCYNQGYSGNTAIVSREDLVAFLDVTLEFIDYTISVNRRENKLYHAYNTLHFDDNTARVETLQMMLEGQVAVLSSGLLEPDEALELLRQLRISALYREDQHSYVLYPDRNLKGFLQKNTFDAAYANILKLVQILIERNDPRLIVKDKNGDYHFGGDIRNSNDLNTLFDELASDPYLADIVEEDSAKIHMLFEQVFNHDSFTGRSGSFFAYEGLGSIYWHMVSKLLLAVQENIYRAQAIGSDTVPALIDIYYDIRAGLGFNKSPDVYGAFPLDPYSHTPRDQGAKQPGMTGMVKEEVITRLGETGIVVDEGEITFNPVLLREEEFLDSASSLPYWDTNNIAQELEIPAGTFAFTICRVPIIVQQASQNQIVVNFNDGRQETISNHQLGGRYSQHIFAHDGIIQQLTISMALS